MRELNAKCALCGKGLWGVITGNRYYYNGNEICMKCHDVLIENTRVNKIKELSSSLESAERKRKEIDKANAELQKLQGEFDSMDALAGHYQEERNKAEAEVARLRAIIEGLVCCEDDCHDDIAPISCQVCKAKAEMSKGRVVIKKDGKDTNGNNAETTKGE